MSRSKRIRIGLIALGVLVAAFPVAAQAQSNYLRPQAEAAAADRPDQIERARAHVTRQIEQRLQILDRLNNRVTNARLVTDEHEAVLLGDYATATRILTAGLDTVAAAETREELRELAPPLFEGTLVKALLGPKTKVVVASDSIAGITGRFAEVESRLGDAIDRLAADGVDVSEAEADLAEAAGLVADAATIGSAVADTVIDLQPGDEFRLPLAEAKADLQTSRRSLREARATIGDVIRFILRNLGDQNGEE